MNIQRDLCQLTLLVLLCFGWSTFFVAVGDAKAYPKSVKNRLRDIPVIQQSSSSPWFFEKNNLNSLTMVDTKFPDLLWRDVRIEDNTNCAYHALKNIILLLNLLQNSDHVQFDLTEKIDLLSPLEHLNILFSMWVPIIYERRYNLLKAKLSGLLDVNESLSKFLLNMYQKSSAEIKKGFTGLIKDTLNDSMLFSYINSNDGHIKTEMLDTVEAQILVDHVKPEKIREKIVVMDDIYVEILQQKNFVAAMQFMQKTDPEGYGVLQKSWSRIQSFQQSVNDVLAILWTEKGFGHWVSYVVCKKDGAVTVYFMNSVKQRMPVHVEALFKYLNISA